MKNTVSKILKIIGWTQEQIGDDRGRVSKLENRLIEIISAEQQCEKKNSEQSSKDLRV